MRAPLIRSPLPNIASFITARGSLVQSITPFKVKAGALFLHSKFVLRNLAGLRGAVLREDVFWASFTERGATSILRAVLRGLFLSITGTGCIEERAITIHTTVSNRAPPTIYHLFVSSEDSLVTFGVST